MAIVLRAVCLTLLCGLAQAAPQATDVSPISGFVENRGQWAQQIAYASRHGRIDASVTASGLVLRPSAPMLAGGDGEAPRLGTAPEGIILRFGDSVDVEGLAPRPTKLHVLRGSEGRGPGSATNIPVFERTALRGVTDGVDVVVRRGDDGFAYDLHVAPGVAAESLIVEIEGAWAPQVTASGALVVETASGPLVQRIGRSWEVGGEDVEARFARVETTSANSIRFGFDVPDRDSSRALVIDPDLVFATYLGGAGQEIPRGMDVGADGATYVTSQGFFDPPTTPGAFETDWTSNSVDVWVCCLSADGASLDWATLISSDDAEDPYGVNVDTDDTVVVFGNAFGADYPTTPGSLQPTLNGPNDLFITRLSADGSSLVWSTFYGGAAGDVARLSTLTPDGDVIITAEPYDPPPPATPGAFDTTFEDGKHLIARVAADGTELLWQGYLPLSPGDLDVSTEGRVYFGGKWLASSGLSFAATPGAFVEVPPVGDFGSAAIVVIAPDGSTIEWSTLVTSPGDTSETLTGIVVEASGAVSITGNVSHDFPVTPGAFDTTTEGGSYVAKVLEGGRGLVWATYISACCGGTSTTTDVDVDSAGRPTMTGSTNEASYPVTTDAFQSTHSSPFLGSDALVTQFGAFGEDLVYSTFFGGVFGSDRIEHIHIHPDGSATLGLSTSSSTLAITPGAFDATYNGGTDTAIVHFDLGLAAWRVLGGGAWGTYGKPNLAGAGDLTAGSATRLSVRGGREASSAFLVAGLDVIDAAVKGGVLVPSPDLLIPLVTDGTGALDLVFPWQVLPPGIEATVQVWIDDPEGPKGWSATNALTIGVENH